MACQVNQEDVRLVLLRIGVVLGKDGGALGCCVSFASFCLFFFLLSFCFLPQGGGSFPSVLHYSPDSSVHLQQRWSPFLWCLLVVLWGQGANGCFPLFCYRLNSICWDPSYSISKQMDLIVSTINFGILYQYQLIESLIARFSWIHLDDLVNLIYESLTNPTYKGDITWTAHPLIPFSPVTVLQTNHARSHANALLQIKVTFINYRIIVWISLEWKIL